METHVAGVSEDSPIGAVGSDDEGFLVALGRAAGAEERNEPGVRWMIRDDPIDCHCCVARADLSPRGG
jgi:hypothetical protein